MGSHNYQSENLNMDIVDNGLDGHFLQKESKNPNTSSNNNDDEAEM